MIALVLLLAAAPQPGALRTFGDWTVGCDNGRACKAVALTPADDRTLAGEQLFLAVTREPGGGAAPVLVITSPDTARSGEALVLAVDGRPVGRVTPAADGDVIRLPLRALARALADGQVVSLTRGGVVLASASLRGLAATFLHIDAEQHRVGTVGALRRTGSRPDRTVPPPPALPRLVAPARSPRPPRTLSVAAAARLIGPDHATCSSGGAVKPDAARLDARHSIVVVAHPCGNGAYNESASVFVVDEAGRTTRALLDDMADREPADRHLVVNGGWDAETRRLISYAKGRGLGDCGVAQTYAWDGARFRLIERSEMGECRGSVEFITTWRATVVAR